MELIPELAKLSLTRLRGQAQTRICVFRPHNLEFTPIPTKTCRGTCSYISKTIVDMHHLRLDKHRLRNGEEWVIISWCRMGQDNVQSRTWCKVVSDKTIATWCKVVSDEAIAGLGIALAEHCGKKDTEVIEDEEEVTKSHAPDPPIVPRPTNTSVPLAQQREKVYDKAEVALSPAEEEEVIEKMLSVVTMMVKKKASQQSRLDLESDPVEAPRRGRKMFFKRTSDYDSASSDRSESNSQR
jgi:hypothetical protein